MHAPEPSGDRLERALAVFLANPPATPADAAALLDAHPDLRDLLEPMLAAEDEPQAAPEGGTSRSFVVGRRSRGRWWGRW